MALRETTTDRFLPIKEEIARALSRRGVRPGDPTKAKGLIRVTSEFSVNRIVQVYWTPFEVSVPGRSIGLHLEVSEPKVHWAECYLSLEYANWVLCFHERADGDIQLAYYEQYEDPIKAVEGFFNLSAWYVLTATDLTWDDVVAQIDDELDWPRHLMTVASAETDKAISESLKKSTIIWLRWKADGVERTMPVWFVYDNKKDKIYVLSGERQQTIEGAERLREATVILRWKGKNARVAEIPADVRVLEPGAEWTEVAEKVAEKRLNIPGLPEETARRWRDECTLLELTLRT
jgi:hypothetical protein